MPESLGSALTTDDLYEDSLVGRLEERQHMHFPHAIQTIQATVADPESAEALQVATGTPLLLVERSYQLETGQVVYISVARYPSNLFHYRVLLTRDSPSIEDWSVAGRTTN
jgi:GntR family transcriptional regulator